MKLVRAKKKRRTVLVLQQRVITLRLPLNHMFLSTHLSPNQKHSLSLLVLDLSSGMFQSLQEVAWGFQDKEIHQCLLGQPVVNQVDLEFLL